MAVRYRHARRCPYCNQPLPEIRLGVEMSDLKARLFDHIMRAGDEGINSDELFVLTYDNWPRRERTKRALYSHIQQINELIEDSGYRIEGRHGNRYINGFYCLKYRAAR